MTDTAPVPHRTPKRSRRIERREERRRASLGPDAAERISAGCYGALVAASTLVGLDTADATKLTLIVVLTNVIYYATHVFAFTIGDSSATRTSTWSSARHHLFVSAPMVVVAFAPLVVTLVLLAFGVPQQNAVLFGVVTAVLYLAGAATTGAHLRGLRPIAVAAVAAATIVGALGLVLAKLTLH